jgi:hypothetical protein
MRHPSASIDRPSDCGGVSNLMRFLSIWDLNHEESTWLAYMEHQRIYRYTDTSPIYSFSMVCCPMFCRVHIQHGEVDDLERIFECSPSSVV